jgi:hypothetical protein
MLLYEIACKIIAIFSGPDVMDIYLLGEEIVTYAST